MGKTLPWKAKLAMLQKFKEHEGHTSAPQGFVDPSTGFRLGRWVANLRQRADYLSESQLNDLENLEFVWSRFKVLPWDRKMEILKRFREEHGHSLVPKEYVDPESKFHLGWWVDRMRQTKKTMNKARIQELEDLEFVWNAFEANWQSMFHLLQEFKALHHHASPKVTSEFRGKPLGHWVGMQRQLYARRQRWTGDEDQQKTTIISDKRIAQLESIDFVWRLRSSGCTDMDDFSCITASTDDLSAPSSPITSGREISFAPMATPSPLLLSQQDGSVGDSPSPAPLHPQAISGIHMETNVVEFL